MDAKRMIKALFTAATLALSCTAWAVDYVTEEVDGYTWTYYVDSSGEAILYNDNNAVVSPAPTGALTIPSTLGGKPVTYIGARAIKNFDSLVSVAIPASMKTIAPHAFYNLSSLANVVIPSGVTYIGANAFDNCFALDYVTVPDSVTTIGDDAFSSCSGLSYAVVPAAFDSEKTRIFGTTSGIDARDVKVEIVDGVAWAYMVSGDEAAVGGGAWDLAVPKDTPGDLTIPSTLGGKTVTGIREYAFYECDLLTSVTIPDSVTTIGEEAFYKCTGLTSVTIGGGVTEIEYGAFEYCSGLTSVEIPDSVTTINGDVFDGCSSLERVSIGAGLTTLGAEAFYNCPMLEVITVADANTTFKSANGLMLTKAGTTLVQGVNGDVTIPDGVETIGEEAFYGCGGLTSVTIPASVTTIENTAFGECSSLTSVTIPDSVTTIGEYAFSGSGLTSVTIPAGVTTIGDAAFGYCSDLKKATLSENGLARFKDAFVGYTDLTVVIADGVIDIPNNAFEGCDGLADVAIPESVATIGESAFYGSGLTEVTVPATIATIGNYAFADCASLATAVVPSGFDTEMEKKRIFGDPYTVSVSARDVSIEVVDGVAWTYTASGGESTVGGGAGGHAIAATTTGDIVVPRTLGGYPVKSIGAGAFKDCVKLVNVLIPSSVTSIGMNAFEGCSSLEGVVIPKSVKSAADVGNDAFKNCSGLAEAVVPAAFEGNIDASVFDGCTWVDINYSDVSVTILDGLAWVYIMDGPDTAKIGGGIGGRAVLPSTAGDIVIPKKIGARTVLEIGASAFADCEFLTGVEIPDSVEILGNSAFEGCNGLESIEIPDSVTEIGESTFAGCSALESVEIGAGVLSIHPYAFDSCLAIEAFSVAEGNTAYKDDGGLLLTKDGKTLVKGVNVAEAVIPDGVETIGDSAFYALPALESVSIPDSLTAIEDYAFDQCVNLADVTFPDGLTAIGEYAFGDCYSLESVAIPGGVKTIAENAFSYCDGLAHVVIASGVEAIEAAAFYDCDGLAEVVIPSTVTTIGDHAFYGCDALARAIVPLAYGNLDKIFENCPCYPSGVEQRSVDVAIVDGVDYVYTLDGEGNAQLGGGFDGLAVSADIYGDLEIPATLNGHPVKVIDSSAFEGCADLESVAIPEGVTEIRSSAFKDCTSLWCVEFPDSLKEIGGSAFDGCTSLWNMTLPDGLTTIGTGAFYGCTSLESVVIPDSMTSIGATAFRDCTALESVVIPSTVTDIGVTAFFNTGLADLIVPDSVTHIADYAFGNCPSLAHAVLPLSFKDSVDLEKLFGTSPCYPDNIKFRDVPVIDGIAWIYTVVDGEAVLGDGADGLAIPKDTAGELVIPATLGGYPVAGIGDCAFERCAGITSVTIPAGVKAIGTDAFYECTALESVTIPDGVEEIGNGAFEFCTSLLAVAIPGTVKTVGGAFSECTALASVTIGDGVEVLGEYAFNGCISLAAIEIPGSVKSIGESAFGDCTALASVTIGNGVEEIGDDAFLRCTSLPAINIPGSVKSIGESAFCECAALKSAKIGDGVESVGEAAFQDCTALTAVKIGAGLLSLAESMFQGCTALQKVSIPENVSDIGKSAFENCTGLRSVTFPNGLVRVGESAFLNCTSLKTVMLKSNVIEIVDGAFIDCDNLKSAIIPKKFATEDLSGAFDVTTRIECRDVMTEMVDELEWVYTIEDGAALAGGGFGGRAVATDTDGELEIPEEFGGYLVTGIADGAFSGCSDLTAVTIPDAVTSVGKDAFRNCTSLTELLLPADVSSVGDNAFEGCAGLTVKAPWVLKDTFTVPADCTIEYYGAPTPPAPTPPVPTTCMVVFDENCSDDVDMSESARNVPGGSAIGELPTATRSGWTFDGWFTAESGGTKVDASFVVTEDVTLYAHWTENGGSGGGDPVIVVWTIGFDSNGGSLDNPTRYLKTGEKLGDLPVAQREGYSFDGWFTESEGGSQVTADWIVTADAVFYAHWTENEPCYEPLEAADITEAYVAPKAVKLYGALYDGCDVVGVIELKLGKVNVKKGTSKIGGTVTLLDGKKYTIKAQTAPVDGTGPSSGYLPVKKLGTLHVTIGGERFAGTLNSWHVQTAKVGGDWTADGATATVEADDLSMFTGTVLTHLLPDGEPAKTVRGKWTWEKAATVKWSKPKKGEPLPEIADEEAGKGLFVDTTKGKSNLSAMKLTYTPKKGTFKGSFKVYELQGQGKKTKLKKYTVKVNGVVVDGVGTGEATLKKPVLRWAVTVK